MPSLSNRGGFLLGNRKYIQIFILLVFLSILVHVLLNVGGKNQDVIDAYEENGFYVQKVQSYGYNMEVPIVIEVKINMKTNQLSEVQVISHEETEDYGGYVTEEWFLNRFIGKAVKDSLQLVKIMPKEENEVVAITGATKTSQGFLNGVNIAMENYKKEME